MMYHFDEIVRDKCMAKWNHESKLNYKNSFCPYKTVALFVYFYTLILLLHANNIVMQAAKSGERKSEKKKSTSVDRMNNKHQTTNKDNATKKETEKWKITEIGNKRHIFVQLHKYWIYINYLYSLYFNLAIIQCARMFVRVWYFSVRFIPKTIYF